MGLRPLIFSSSFSSFLRAVARDGIFDRSEKKEKHIKSFVRLRIRSRVATSVFSKPHLPNLAYYWKECTKDKINQLECQKNNNNNKNLPSELRCGGGREMRP